MNKKEKAFRDALILCVDKAMLFARTLTRNTADAEDVVQEALTKAMCNWEAFEPETNLQAWLNRIVKNLFLDKMKSHAETKTESVGDDTSRLDKTTNSGPEATLVAEQVHDFMFLHMPEKERSIVLLWAEGFSYKEIAQSMGITRSNAGVLLCRARKRLFDQFGPSAGDFE